MRFILSGQETKLHGYIQSLLNKYYGISKYSELSVTEQSEYNHRVKDLSEESYKILDKMCLGNSFYISWLLKIFNKSPVKPFVLCRVTEDGVVSSDEDESSIKELFENLFKFLETTGHGLTSNQIKDIYLRGGYTYLMDFYKPGSIGYKEVQDLQNEYAIRNRKVRNSSLNRLSKINIESILYSLVKGYC